jgi:hypothetical protein
MPFEKTPESSKKEKSPGEPGEVRGGWKKGEFKYPGRGVQPGEC